MPSRGMEFPMKRVGNTLVLTSPAFEEDFYMIKEGVELTVPRPRRSRSPKQNNAFHAVLNDLMKAGYWDDTMESFKRHLKMRASWGDWFPMTDGVSAFVVRPTPEDQTEFNDFVERIKDALIKHFGVEPETLEILFKRWSKDGQDAEQRLLGLADSLALDSTEALEKKWSTTKKDVAILKLFRAYPIAVENILTAARAYARGRYTRPQFDEEIELILRAALEVK